jgi:hypothetical protein
MVRSIPVAADFQGFGRRVEQSLPTTDALAEKPLSDA